MTLNWSGSPPARRAMISYLYGAHNSLGYGSRNDNEHNCPSHCAPFVQRIDRFVRRIQSEAFRPAPDPDRIADRSGWACPNARQIELVPAF